MTTASAGRGAPPSRTPSGPHGGGRRRHRPAAAAAVGWQSVACAVAAALMAVAHAGVRIPLVSALGPGGTRPIWPAALVFAAGAAIFAGLARGAFRQSRWVWPAGVVVNALAAVSMLRPFRDTGSAVGLALFAIGLVVLLSPAGRRAFRS